MKPLLLLLFVVSLAANAVLLVNRTHSAASLFSGSESKSLMPTTVSGPGGKSATAPDSNSNGAPALASAQTWSLLATDDLKAMAAKLRTAGFPDSMVRAMIRAQIHDRFAARRQQLLPQQADVPYWKKQPSMFDPARMSALRQLGREETAMQKEALGADSVRETSAESRAYLQRQFGNLPPEKLDQLQSILSDYGELSNEVYAKSNGVLLPEDRAKLAMIEKERQADLATAMTPEEFSDYELRSSQTANTLRRQLTLFNPTEDEYKALFALQKKFDQQFPQQFGLSAPDQMAQRRQAQLDMQSQAEAVLSPDRFSEYKQITDPQNQMLSQLVARLDLPVSTLPQINAVQQDLTQRANAIRRDSSLSPQAQNEQLAGLSQEASSKITGILGKDGFEAYKSYGGFWLQTLQPRTVRPKTN